MTDGIPIDAWILSFALMLARVGTFIATLPLTGGRNLPRTVKVGLAAALTLMWFGVFGTDASSQLAEVASSGRWFHVALVVVREIVVGAALGFAFGLILIPTRIAGAYIGQEMGLTLGAISDPGSPESGSVVSRLFEAIGILIFFALDVHHVILAFVHVAFQRWPLGSDLPSFSPTAVVDGVGAAHDWGILLAAPVGVCLFAAIVVLALLTKASPQLNLFSVGLAMRVAVGLIGLLVFLPDVCFLMQRLFSKVEHVAQTLLLMN